MLGALQSAGDLHYLSVLTEHTATSSCLCLCSHLSLVSYSGQKSPTRQEEISNMQSSQPQLEKLKVQTIL